MPTLLARLVRGTVAGVAGVVGTLAMDLLWWRRHRAGGGGDGFADWEFSTGIASFDGASAPGQVGRRLARVLGIDLPDEPPVRGGDWTGACGLSDGSEA